MSMININLFVQCDLCEHWIHGKCNNLHYLDYRYFQNCNESWYFTEFCSKIFPFNSLSCDKDILDSSIMQQWKGPISAQNSSLLLTTTPNSELFSILI